MKKHSRSHYIKSLLLPCLFFSLVTGVVSALLIALFQRAAEGVVALSGFLYGAVRQNPLYLPVLLLGAGLLGLFLSGLLSFSNSCRGGGIPTAIAAIRGITPFRWLKSLLLLPVSALCTFLSGLPLGTEGPSVQMGTAVGDGAVALLGGKRFAGWRRYIMTGGASAGFALATGAPITAILFTMEEIHNRFSPLLFSVASLSVLSSHLTARLLRHFGFASVGLFHVPEIPALPISRIFLPLFVGLLAGAVSLLFTRLYHRIDNFMRVTLARIPLTVKFPVLFVLAALTGFFFDKALGTGHHLTEELFTRGSVWYLLILAFLLRALFLLAANTAGVTGGLFLPTLAFGAILGALSAEVFIALGLMGTEHYLLFVILGITAFLGANSRIPLTACIFAVEALSGIHNLAPLLLAAAAAFFVVGLSGEDDFTDTVIHRKARALHGNKEPVRIEVPMTVYKDSFVVGKELRDILWPATCVVLHFQRSETPHRGEALAEGDVITVYYETYDPWATAEEFEVLIGDQPPEIDAIMRPF